jgi:sarcosine oxidase subunit beta
LAGAPLTGGWAGLVELTPDHHPLLGPIPGLDGLVVATGFSGHGVMHAPAAGTLIAELLLDGQATTLDIAPLSPLRFADGLPIATGRLERQTEQGDIGLRPTS